MKVDFRPDGMNIELTNTCPLRCPQCYCTLEGGKNIPLDIAVCYLKEASQLGVTHVELSGGETMCYPHLFEIVKAATEYHLTSSIAISGWHFDKQVLERLIDAGIGTICVSLNGPTEESNSLTRDGYELAIHALDVLQKQGFENTMINWVMHRSSVNLLPDMIALAERYHVAAILIMDPKPTSKGEFHTYPTYDQMLYVADMVKHPRSDVELIVQHCFSPLLALSCENKLWGNRNRGQYKGCTAGICSFAIDVNGYFVPCRHLYQDTESRSSVQDYWENSHLLAELRSLDSHRKEPCASCYLCRYCRHCVAQNRQLNNELVLGNEQCPLARYRTEGDGE